MFGLSGGCVHLVLLAGAPQADRVHVHILIPMSRRFLYYGDSVNVVAVVSVCVIFYLFPCVGGFE